MSRLLTRDQFREQVFSRDNHACVLCGKPAKDAHHILERRLWPEGNYGYYLDNGASVCSACHIACEQTVYSVEQVREACGILKAILPPHLYDDQVYDKWGNIILPNGQRTKGELFYDESVQKVLKDVLHLFTDYVKYPRTHHLPWSASISDDDRIIDSLEAFVGQRVIVTEKLDGENTTLYTDYYHARSIDSKNHPSRNWAKALHSKFAHDIPKAWRLCCENLYAQHSIAYNNLESYLYGISIWNEHSVCLDWNSTVEWFKLFELPVVPVLYDGIWDETIVRGLYDDRRDWENHEGYVVRVASEFHYGQFRKVVAKYVRAKHVQTVKHWMQGQEIVPNKLKGQNG